jgi:hypothetical protein
VARRSPPVGGMQLPLAEDIVDEDFLLSVAHIDNLC